MTSSYKLACEHKRCKCGSEPCHFLREKYLGRLNRNCKGPEAEADPVHSRKSKNSVSEEESGRVGEKITKAGEAS